MENRIIIRDPFFYAVNVTVANGATVNAQLNIDAQSDFELISLQQHSNIAGAAHTFNTEPVPNVTLLIQEASSGRYFSDNPVDLVTLAGSGREPYFLPSPRLLLANSVLNMQFTSYDAAATYVIRLTFSGMKLFRR